MTWKGIGSLSYSGAAKAQQSEAPVLSLTITVPADEPRNSLEGSGQACYIHPDDYQVFAAFLCGAPAFLQHASGSDCLISLEADSQVPRGAARMPAVQRFNMRVCHR